MPRPTIEYLNARRDLKPASGGTNYKLSETATLDPNAEIDAFDAAMATIRDFAFWAEITRQQRYGSAPLADDEIPF